MNNELEQEVNKLTEQLRVLQSDYDDLFFEHKQLKERSSELEDFVEEIKSSIKYL